MKFKQFQQLKKRAYTAFATESRMAVPVIEPEQTDPISLAFVGDACYALYFRRWLLKTGIPNVQVLHTLAAEFVSAKVQSVVFRHIRGTLTETECSVCKRARNAYSQTPKSASVAEYHDSTALEALIGYLVVSNQQDRLAEVMEQVYTCTREYCRNVHQKELL